MYKVNIAQCGELFEIGEVLVQQNADPVVLLKFVAVQNVSDEQLNVYHGLLVVLAANFLEMDGQKVGLLFVHFLFKIES